MKIIHFVLGKANPNKANGVNQVVHNIAESLQESKVNIEVWGLTQDIYSSTPERSYKLKLFNLDKFFYTISDDLKKNIMNLEKDDWVHFHGALIPVFSRIAKILKGNKIKYTVTAHGNLQPLKLYSLKKKVVFMLYEKSLYSNAHRIHSFSNYEKNYMKNYFHTIQDSQFCIIPNGVSLSLVKQRDFKNIKNEVTFCGRLNYREKGVDYLIKGFIQYLKNGGVYKLNIIGDGPVRKECEDLVEKANLKDKVTFYGSLFGSEKNNVFSQSKFYIQPSLSEGMAISVIEANAMGIPSIISEATGCADYILKHKCGFIVQPNCADIFRILNEIEQISEKDYYEKCINAQNMVLNELNWKAISQKYCKELYAL